MSLFKFELTIESLLSQNEANEKLSQNIGNQIPALQMGMQRYNCDKLFRGSLLDYNFDIRRCLNYRNDFIPNIRGIILKSGDYSTIKVKIELRPFLKTFMLIFIAFFIIFGIVSLYATLNGNGKIEMLIFPVFVAIFAGAFYYLFEFEKKKAVKILKILLKSK